MSLSLKETVHSDITILELKGDILGGPQAAELNDRLHQLVVEKKLKIVVDLASVSFMNSSGLGMLIGALTTMRTAGGILKLASANERIQSLLVITKLSSLFQSYPSVEDAISSF